MGLMESRCCSVDWVGIYTAIAEVANFEKQIAVCLSLFLFLRGCLKNSSLVVLVRVCVSEGVIQCLKLEAVQGILNARVICGLSFQEGH